MFMDAFADELQKLADFNKKLRTEVGNYRTRVADLKTIDPGAKQAPMGPRVRMMPKERKRVPAPPSPEMTRVRSAPAESPTAKRMSFVDRLRAKAQ
jgi:hypothetical protein